MVPEVCDATVSLDAQVGGRTQDGNHTTNHTLATVPQSLSECRIDLHDAHGHTPLKAETVMHIWQSWVENHILPSQFQLNPRLVSTQLSG